MPSTTQTSIMDRAAQLLGQAQISSPQQVGSRTAKALLRAYQPTKISELTKFFWHFAIKRASLAASGTPPVHTKRNAFPLPTDYLMLAPPDQDGDFPFPNDRTIEGNQIISDDDGPLPIRYIADVSESLFDPIFAEALSCALAIGTCEEITNSNSKLVNLGGFYDLQITTAKRRGSILIQKQRLPISSWISARG